MSRSISLLKSLSPQLWQDLGERSVGDQSNLIVEALCDDVSAQLQSTLADFKQTVNATLVHARLPAELWCLVWSWLPVPQDLITVTHVCHKWRAIALDHASFWKNVHYFTTVHERGSSCEDGMCGSEWVTDSMQCDDDGKPQPMHNLQKVETFLGRSKGAALRFEVAIYHRFSERSLAVELAEIVKPHAHRIDSLVCNFGDVSFFVDFMKQIKEFPSLQILHVQRTTYCDDESNIWPMSKMRLEHLTIPRLREFESDASFWWDMPRTLEGQRSWTALEYLGCDFVDARSFYDCLRTCSNLVLLEGSLGIDAPRSLSPGPPEDAAELVRPPEDAAELAPCLRDLDLYGMTPLWESVLRPIIRRASLTDLRLRYTQFDTNSLFDSMPLLEGGVQLDIWGGSCPSVGQFPSAGEFLAIRAEDEHSRTHFLDLGLIPRGPRIFITLSHMWAHLTVRNVWSLKVDWNLRAVLLNRRIDAPGIVSIELVVCNSDTGPQPGIADLMALNGPSVAGRPSFPNLAVLRFTSSVCGRSLKLLATSVQDFAATISDSECSLILMDVELVENAS